MIEKRLGFRKHRLNGYLLLTLCTALPIFAQRTAAITSAAGGTANGAAADALRSKVAPKAATNRPGVVLFTGDTVFAQVVDGGTWKTSFIISNLDTVSRHCEVRFFRDDGTDMLLPIFSADLQGDLLSGVSLTINPGGTVFFETAGRRGSIEFQTSGFGIGVLGLRFSPYGSFTSFNILTNFSWIAQ
jgi:hypothetical protein